MNNIQLRDQAAGRSHLPVSQDNLESVSGSLIQQVIGSVGLDDGEPLRNPAFRAQLLDDIVVRVQFVLREGVGYCV